MKDGPLGRQYFEMLMESQFWSADQLRDYQRSQLVQLLIHAKNNAPFYRTRLDVLFTRSGDIDWDRWADVPILKRSDLREHGEQLRAGAIPPGHGRQAAVSTSGTSGLPISVWWTSMGQLAYRASRYRAYRWHGVDWTKTSCSVSGDDPTRAAWPEGERMGPWGPDWDPASRTGQTWRINRREPQERKLEFIGRKGVSYLASGPSAIYALALEAEHRGIKLDLDVILPHGAAVSDTDRAAFGRVFGARALDTYASKEGGNVAHACPDSDGMHVAAEMLLVEIVDHDGRPVPQGELGRVVITPFFSTAQPLIRYDQGDVARFAPTCSCGRHLPRLDGLIGRSTTVFYHPDGRVRSSFVGMYRSLLNCSVWQIAQTGPTDFEVRYVPLDPAIDGDEAGITRILKQQYFDDAEIRFVKLGELPLLPTGKPAEYLNEWTP